MAKRKAPKRTKTKYTNIYFNEQSKLYDIKYNYKVYNPHTKKNDYKAKWVYGIATIGQAQSEFYNVSLDYITGASNVKTQYPKK